jgi:hypothetical protein
MIDTRAVAQEIQEQVLAAVHRGHEQFRKGQDQVRKSQQQGREAARVAVRTGSQVAKAVLPSLPQLPRPEVHLPSVSDLTSPDKLRAHAHDLAGQALANQRRLADSAGQVLAAQRKLAEKAVEFATPLVAEGVNRITQVAGSIGVSHRTPAAEPAARVVTAAPAEATPAADAPPAETAATASSAEPAAASTTAASTAEPSTAEPSTAKTSTAKATKPRAAKTAASRAKATTKPAAKHDRTAPKPRAAGK